MANRLPAGSRLQMLTKVDTTSRLAYVSPSDRMWADAPDTFVRELGECEHTSTCCKDCIVLWAQDWLFRVVDEEGNTRDW